MKTIGKIGIVIFFIFLVVIMGGLTAEAFEQYYPHDDYNYSMVALRVFIFLLYIVIFSLIYYYLVN
jgi:hypothetical protein